MKKTINMLLVIALILSMLVLCSCGSNENHEWTKESSIFELSDLTWYLTEKFEISDYENCQVYDLYGLLPASILVKLPGSYDVCDFILMQLISDLNNVWGVSLTEPAVAKVSYTCDECNTYGLEFNCVVNNKNVYIPLLFTVNDSGYIDKILFEDVMFLYEYDEYGMINALYESYESNLEDLYTTTDDCEILLNVNACTFSKFKYVYNSDNTLKSIDLSHSEVEINDGKINELSNAGQQQFITYEYDKDCRRIKSDKFRITDENSFIDRVLYEHNNDRYVSNAKYYFNIPSDIKDIDEYLQVNLSYVYEDDGNISFERASVSD